MTYTCTSCNFGENPDDQPSCIACGTHHMPYAPPPTSPEFSAPSPVYVANAINRASSTSSDAPRRVKISRASSRVSSHNSSTSNTHTREEIFSLEKGEKLSLKLRAPKKGKVIKGISVDQVENHMLNGVIMSGDLIIRVGQDTLAGMGFKQAIELIRDGERPLDIIFEVCDSRRQAAEKKKNANDIWDVESQLTTYAVVFEEGAMGLNLEEASKYGIDGACVKGVKGQAESFGSISLGDIVSKVNESDVLFIPYKEVMNCIRNSTVPRTIQFVPKDKLHDIQQINHRQTEFLRTSGVGDFPLATRETVLASSKRLNDNDDESSNLTDLINENSSATIKKGKLFKQGRLVRNYKARFFVLSVSKFEYFKSPVSTTSRGELEFNGNRCTVRDLPPNDDVVTSSPRITAAHLIELRVSERKLVIACTNDGEKKAWMDALKLAIDASKSMTYHLATPENSLNTARKLRMAPSDTSDAYPTPMVYVTVVSASELAKRGSYVNCRCEITLDSESFQTPLIKNHRNPVWKEDNSASFEAYDEDGNIEVRLYDEHTIRANDLIATLNIPLSSLTVGQKVTRKFPLVLNNRSAGSSITLDLEYLNYGKAAEEQRVAEQKKAEEEKKSSSHQKGPVMARASVLIERNEMLKIRQEAQEAADEAAETALSARKEADILLKEAHKKANDAVAAGNEKVEAALLDAKRAKEEAELQAAEAIRSQEEAQALIQANKEVQLTTDHLDRNRENMSLDFIEYRRMLTEMSQAKVRENMVADNVDENTINAFFEGIASYELKMKDLQANVDVLKRQAKKTKKEDEFAVLANSAISGDQEKLLRRLLKLEKQLQQAGITIAEDIPYEEAKTQVTVISERMQEIGSADVIHDDLTIQKALREEYYRLEQDMEKYNTALMLSDEYASEQDQKARLWEEANALDNIEALMMVRRCMPVNIKSLSEAQLQENATPKGLRMKQDMARKFKRTNSLALLRVDPKDIAVMHPSLLENLRVTGLLLTERRALHLHLKDIAEVWQSQKQEEMAGRKWVFFKSLRDTFKPLATSYNNHVGQYGPAGNHPYASREDADGYGCPLIGRQCPLKANAVIDYTVDLGYPAGDVYVKSTVQKADAEDAGAKALREAKELSRAKAANVRSDTLKKHYKRDVREAAKANGVCDDIDALIDTIENTVRGWIVHQIGSTRVTRESQKIEINGFTEFLKKCHLACTTFTERSGISLSGKRDVKNDTTDTRSGVEIDLLDMLLESINDALESMEKRLKVIKAKDKRLVTALSNIRQLINDITVRNDDTMIHKKPLRIAITKKRVTIAQLTQQIKEAALKTSVSDDTSTSTSPPIAVHHSSGPVAGRGRGGRGRGGLMDALQGRGSSGGRGGGPGGLMAAIAGRGRGPAGGRGGGPGGLMAAIAGRGRGPAGGRGDMMAALAARRKKE